MDGLQWWALWLAQTQVQARGWLEENGALIVAVLALIGSLGTGYWGWKQKRTPTGEAQLDDERQYRLELRAENKDLKAEVVELEKLNDALNTQNKQLRKENEQLAEIRAKLEAQNTLLVEQAQHRDREIQALKEDVARLTRDVTRLERRREPRTEAGNDSPSN